MITINLFLTCPDIEIVVVVVAVVGLIESSLQHKLNCENFTVNS